jgi:hypothetical protein
MITYIYQITLFSIISAGFDYNTYEVGWGVKANVTIAPNLVKAEITL